MWIKHEKYIFSWARSSRLRFRQGWFHSEASLLDLQVAITGSVLTEPVHCEDARVLIFSSSKDTGDVELGPTHMTPFYLNCLFRNPVSKHSHIQR